MELSLVATVHNSWHKLFKDKIVAFGLNEEGAKKAGADICFDHFPITPDIGLLLSLVAKIKMNTKTESRDLEMPLGSFFYLPLIVQKSDNYNEDDILEEEIMLQMK